MSFLLQFRHLSTAGSVVLLLVLHLLTFRTSILPLSPKSDFHSRLATSELSDLCSFMDTDASAVAVFSPILFLLLVSAVVCCLFCLHCLPDASASSLVSDLVSQARHNSLFNFPSDVNAHFAAQADAYANAWPDPQPSFFHFIKALKDVATSHLLQVVYITRDIPLLRIDVPRAVLGDV